MSIRLILVSALIGCCVVLVSAGQASARPAGACGTVKAGGATWTVFTLNIKCSVAKAALPKLVTEKPYGQVRRSALIKPPAGFKPCGVSFTATSKKIVTIECTKKQGTSMIFQRK